jgi:hypothetical protein
MLKRKHDEEAPVEKKDKESSGVLKEPKYETPDPRDIYNKKIQHDLAERKQLVQLRINAQKAILELDKRITKHHASLNVINNPVKLGFDKDYAAMVQQYARDNRGYTPLNQKPPSPPPPSPNLPAAQPVLVPEPLEDKKVAFKEKEHVIMIAARVLKPVVEQVVAQPLPLPVMVDAPIVPEQKVANKKAKVCRLRFKSQNIRLPDDVRDGKCSICGKSIRDCRCECKVCKTPQAWYCQKYKNKMYWASHCAVENTLGKPFLDELNRQRATL